MTRPPTNKAENTQPIGRAVQYDDPLIHHGGNTIYF